MVSDILDMNKLESGTLEPESVPFDIFALLMESNHLTEMQAPAYGVTVHVKNPPSRSAASSAPPPSFAASS